jgi:mannose-6-phosphate isomerase-like protein (cupin superfamily)
VQHLKRPIILLLAVIFSVVLGALLVSYQPAFADGSPLLECNPNGIQTKDCILKPDTQYNLDLNSGYIIKLNQALPESDDGSFSSLVNCYDKTIYAKFTFESTPNSREPNSTGAFSFSETYPIQADWELHFNTPLSGSPGTSISSTGILEINSDPQCELQVKLSPNQTLQLFSGIKSIQDKEIGDEEIDPVRNPSGHFALGRDYYAAQMKQLQEECPNSTTEIHDDNQKNYYDQDKQICYQRLGSLSPITGKNFPGLGGVSVAQIIIKPDSIRAPHWHLQFAETGYCYEGLGQVGVIVPPHTIPKDEKDEEFYDEKIIEEIFLKPNEVFLFPEGSQHYLRNIGHEDFKCILFFAEGPPLNGDQLLSISLQNIVSNTPVGVLNSVFVANQENTTISKISDSPTQSFSPKDQRSNVIPVVEACSGDLPNIEDPGCPPKSEKDALLTSRFSLYSDVDP